jgi:hypothetical protein
MIAPLAELLDWLAIQMVWGRRVKSLLKLPSPAAGPKLEEALQFLNGPDFIPLESPPARLEFDSARSGIHFRFSAPQPSQFVEQNVVYGRLHRCAEGWQKQQVIILLDGNPPVAYNTAFHLFARRFNRAGFNVATLVPPYKLKRRPSLADAEAGSRLAPTKERRLTQRWSQRRLPLEFMDELDFTLICEFAKPPAGRRGSALDCQAALALLLLL